MKAIYLDYAATTPVDERVAEKMWSCLTKDGEFGNPASSTHKFGTQAASLVEKAREQVASLINAKSSEIIWTSGATEADNLALKGLSSARRDRGNHIITTTIEHKAVLDTCKFLGRNGFRVTYLPVASDGLISFSELEKAVCSETILISVIHGNNEIGVLQDICKIGEFAAQRDIAFHVDAAQSAGKIPIDVREIQVDLLSLSAHKIYGPKGIGALFVRENSQENLKMLSKPKTKIKLEPMIHGGGHEKGLRSGTLATHQIVGMGEACSIASQGMATESHRLSSLKERLWEGLRTIEAVQRNGNVQASLPNILNVSFKYIEGEALLLYLKDIAVSTGSACTSATLEPSYVLKALGLKDELAHSSIRFSLGRFTTEEEIDHTIEEVKKSVSRLREMSPLWEMYKEGVDLEKIDWQE